MDTVNSRMFAVRKSLKLSQESFGMQIGLSRSEVRNIEDEKTALKDKTVNVLCRTFNVNEEWLRKGVGDMFLQLSVADEIIAFAAETTKLDRDDPRVQILSMLAQLPQEDWGAVADMIDILKNDKK